MCDPSNKGEIESLEVVLLDQLVQIDAEHCRYLVCSSSIRDRMWPKLPMLNLYTFTVTLQLDDAMSGTSVSYAFDYGS